MPFENGGRRKRSALTHTIAAGESVAVPLRTARNSVAAALRAVVLATAWAKKACAKVFTSMRKPVVNPSALVCSARDGSPLSRWESAQSATQVHVQGAWVDGSELALAAPCACHVARFRGRSFRHGADFARARVAGSTREIYIGSVPENARTADQDVEKLSGPKFRNVRNE